MINLSVYSSMGVPWETSYRPTQSRASTRASAYTLSLANGQTSISDKKTRPLQLSIGRRREKITLRTVHLPRHESHIGNSLAQAVEPLDRLDKERYYNPQGRTRLSHLSATATGNDPATQSQLTNFRVH
jgi:hypothetical protein